MKAEIAKARYLPTPRWMSAATVGLCVVVGVVLIFVAPANPATYVNVSSIAAGVAATIPMLVLGVWVIAVEFGSGTLQRTLTAEADRSRVLASKLVLAVVGAAVLSLAAAAASGGLATLAGQRAGVTIDQSDLARAVFSAVPAGIGSVVVGFAFGLLSRSMGGGIALAAVFTFVLDGFLRFVPGLSKLSYGSLSADLTNHLAGTGATSHSIGVALLGVLLWLGALVVPGWLWFTRGDLK